jgi:hypothetical protein
MGNENTIGELRKRLTKLQGFQVDDSLTEEELSDRITNIILNSELPKFKDALRRLGES